MNRVTRNQVLPRNIVHERIKHRLFRFMYEHNDRDFLDVATLLLEHITECDNHGPASISQLDQVVDKFLNELDNPKKQQAI